MRPFSVARTQQIRCATGGRSKNHAPPKPSFARTSAHRIRLAQITSNGANYATSTSWVALTAAFAARALARADAPNSASRWNEKSPWETVRQVVL
jgi:hypothetical protein